jgi:hypothetical protein
MNTLSRKSYGAIYVKNPNDIDKVKEIIKEMDEFEYDYLPDELIKPFADYPQVAYTHKFCDLDMDDLTAKCWAKGVLIWVFDARQEYPRSALANEA